jgi:hypothetical protein
MRQLYKGFKKIAEDDNSAKLVHDDGHQLVISKKGLSKPLLDGLHSLPLHQYDGTKTPEDATEPQYVSDADWQAQQVQPAVNTQEQPVTEKHSNLTGAKIGRAVGTALREHGLKPLIESTKDSLTAFQQGVLNPGSELIKGLAGVDEAESAEAAPAQAATSTAVAPSQPQPSTLDVMRQRAQMVPSAWHPPMSNATANQPLKNVTPGGIDAIPDYSQFQSGQIPPQMAGLPGFEQAMGAYQQIGKAEQAEAQRQAQLYRNAADASRLNQELFNNSHQELQNDINDTLQRIESQQIRPNHYLENMSAGQKIMIAIGGLIAGAGAGAAHQENPVYKFLNSQIERDLASQKANVENQNNLLSHLQNKYHNDLVAENMFRVMRAETLANEIAQAGSTSKFAQAMPNAQLAQAKLMQMYMPFYQSAVAMNAYQKLGQAGAGQQMMSQNQSADQQAQIASMQAQQLLRAGMIAPEQHKQIDQEIQDQYKTTRSHQEIDKLIDAIGEQQSLGNRAFSPIQSKAKINAYAASLIPLIQSEDPSTRLTEESIKKELAPFIPGMFSSAATRETIKQIGHNMVDRQAKYPSASSGFPDLTLPKYKPVGPQLEYANGKYWRKIPGGRLEVRQTKVTQ